MSTISKAGQRLAEDLLSSGKNEPTMASTGQNSTKDSSAFQEEYLGCLSNKDESLVRLFLSICCHKWDDVVSLGQRSLDNGASNKELLGCVRHICV